MFVALTRVFSFLCVYSLLFTRLPSSSSRFSLKVTVKKKATNGLKYWHIWVTSMY